MGRKSRQKLYQFVDALVETGTRKVADEARTVDLSDPDQAREVMREIAHLICNQYARTVLYVPADLEFKLSQRDLEIWAQYSQDGPDGVRKFSPQRVAQLADEQKLTTVQIYCICKLMHRREIEGRQGRLPGIEVLEEVC